jgi:hypothetical protein
MSSMGSNGVGAVRGQLAKKKGSVAATGPLGSGCNLGAVGAGQYLYASFHVFAARDDDYRRRRVGYVERLRGPDDPDRLRADHDDRRCLGQPGSPGRSPTRGTA